MINEVYHRKFTKTIFIKLFPVIILFLALLILASCNRISENNSKNLVFWHYSDLRAIDPVDAELTNMDIIAFYIKESNENLYLRLDLLEMNLSDMQEIYIGIDYKPVGSRFYKIGTNLTIQSEIQWDIALKFPNTGEIRGYNSQGELISGIKARVFRDTALDIITISIDRQKLLPDGIPLVIEVMLKDPLSDRIVDRIDPVNSRSIPPDPAQVIMGFTNTFIAYTPAQALRMWDGAHTGPMSSRHGLRHLIEAAENADVNISLFDVCSPISVSGLNYLGVYRDIMWLVREGILDFGGCFCECVDIGCWDIYGASSGYAKMHSQQFDDLLSLDIRKKIVDAALDGSILFVGGDLSDSAWGNPTLSANAFNYIKNHPWILTVKSSNLTKLNKVGENGCMYKEIHTTIDSNAQDNFKKQYYSAPDNILKELARQTYMTFVSPANPAETIIHENYFGQLGHILSAAAWHADPISISTCDLDLDWDGLNECVLSSEKIYLTFELTGGYLAFAFYRNDAGAHQITAPMSEVVIGLGDPSTYDKKNGVFADPSLIQGALAKLDENENIYTYKIGVDFIELFNEITNIRKTFRINDNSILIKWNANRAQGYVVPFGIDPWLRFNLDWSDRYFTQSANENWILGIKDHLAIQIKSSSPAYFATFLDSKIFIEQPEDPNFEYPRGHYLPFPFAILDVAPTESALIEVNILDP